MVVKNNHLKKVETMDIGSCRKWMFLASVTLLHFLETGLLKSLSVLLPNLQEQLMSRTWIIGACISIVCGWGYVLGLLSGIIWQRVDLRTILIASGCVTSLGLLICAVATDVSTLCIGLLFVGFVYLQETVAVAAILHYFDDYFAVCVTIFLTGCNVAVIIMPPLTQIILDTYGFRGTLALLSSISFNSVVCGALAKPHKKPFQTVNQNYELHEKEDGRFCRWLKTIWHESGVHLLTSNRYYLVSVLIPGFAWGYTYSGWLIYSVSYALSIGAPLEKAALVSTCGGIGLTFTRLIIPLLTKHIQYKLLLYISLLLASVSLCISTLIVTLTSLTICFTILGVAISILSVSLYLAAKATVDDKDYANAVAWYHFTFGFASIFTGSISGIIYDATGTFRTSFAVLAAVPLLACIGLGVNDLYDAIQSKDSQRL